MSAPMLQFLMAAWSSSVMTDVVTMFSRAKSAASTPMTSRHARKNASPSVVTPFFVKVKNRENSQHDAFLLVASSSHAYL